MAQNKHIPEADRIPLIQKIMFSAGTNMDTMSTGMLINSLWMPYFNIGLGISPTLIGMVMVVLLTWNAFSDPLMGNISDNARTRWGRRRPFMTAGAILTGCVYPLFWYMPSGMGEKQQAVYLIAVGLVFFSCFTTWSMPYYGLQLELTPNYDERTRLTSWMTLFGKISNLISGWVLAIATCSWFINPSTGKGDIVIGMKTLCWFIAGSIILFGLLPPIFVKERYYDAEASRQARSPFWRSIKESATCGPVWSLIGISFFMFFGSLAVSSLSYYLIIYYIYNGDIAAASVLNGWKNTAVVVTGIVMIPLWAWLGEILDKKKVLISMIAFSMLGHLLNCFCMRPDMPYLLFLPAVFESGAIAAVWLFVPSMKADTADYDEMHTNRRREGSINSFFSWFFKGSMVCSMGVGGLVLEFSGFSAKLTQQPPEVLHRMVSTYLVLPIVLWGIALFIALFYPLTRQRMAAIRAELELRRGAV